MIFSLNTNEWDINKEGVTMFEKEAEEWANKMYPCDGQAQRYLLMGAKFGYEQGIEEVLSKLSHHERMKVKALLKEVSE
jgi:hypothetical protein